MPRENLYDRQSPAESLVENGGSQIHDIRKDTAEKASRYQQAAA